MSTIEPVQDREEWQSSDDYGSAWRNPRFQPPTAAVSAPLAPEHVESDHAPALTTDGFTAALRALGRDGGER